MLGYVKLLIVLGAIACGGALASGQERLISQQERRAVLSAQETTIVNNIAAALRSRYDIAWERVSGHVSYPNWDLTLVKLPVRSIDSAFSDVGEENAFAVSSSFLKANAKSFGLEKIEFELSRTSEHHFKEKLYSKEVICHLTQKYHGVEIFGGLVKVHFVDSFLVRISLAIETGRMPKTDPDIGKDSAFQIAARLATEPSSNLKSILGRRDNTFGDPARSANEMSLSGARLLVLSPRVMGEEGPTRLMWELKLNCSVPESCGATGSYFIDAHNGEFLWRSSGRTDCW